MGGWMEGWRDRQTNKGKKFLALKGPGHGDRRFGFKFQLCLGLSEPVSSSIKYALKPHLQKRLHGLRSQRVAPEQGVGLTYNQRFQWVGS